MHVTSTTRALKFKGMANYLSTKRPRISSHFDHSYFDSYADVAVHEEMLGDEIRTSTYKNAIFSLKSVFSNKVGVTVKVVRITHLDFFALFYCYRWCWMLELEQEF